MIQFRPINQWPRSFTKSRRNSPFTAGYKDTLDKLEYEIEQLRGKTIVIQLAIGEDDLRNDGWPRASARPSHPGVIVSFESRHGFLTFACDEFESGNGRIGWQANLRGIALTLERLRLADLYGVTKSGEQYTGWKQLPPAPEPQRRPFANETDAARFVLAASKQGFNEEHVQKVLADADYFKIMYRTAAKHAHPDCGGNEGMMTRLNEAVELLKRRHGL